ncbi:sigma-70 family RNA polymerase sigma factor [Alicyclobacillus tolerans]|uniref:sigma-70 family RNA polymerase sigma factor n=1 Tax=Alicyclobacillus tolerans TaxID=90970 RepID=UPI001F2F6B48|nr:sigma-70 family RNA polymerase sigma factor [Alicyclobacillus tolerans]MCF8567752.1 sigma-70 family RNA polymerase sigma factor [Alicyclobacillus tolerans]
MTYSDYLGYTMRLAKRLIGLRMSGVIDESDLVSSAMMRLWEREQKQGGFDEKTARMVIKYAMLEVIKSSAAVRVPRSMSRQEAIHAYQKASTIMPDEEPQYSPVEEWLDKEPVREVKRIVDGLPYEERLLLSLIWEQGCSMQHAADILSTSKTRIHERYNNLLRTIKGKLLVQRRNSSR